MGQLGAQMELEDYNQAAIILDIDGNSWSDRFSRISHFPSPILKKASSMLAMLPRT